jgi:hypothetical protein
MLQYYRNHLGRNKFKYDHTNNKWIDVDCIIITMIMSYNFTNEVYTLDRNDSHQLSKFLTKRTTVPGRQGRQKIIPQKNAEKIKKFIKYFVEINKNEVNKNCRQKTKENL